MSIPSISRVSDSMRVVREVEYVERVRDTVLYAELPREAFQGVGSDSSFLETSVAFSVARVDDRGRLFHLLENKRGALPVSASLREIERRELRDSTAMGREYVEKIVTRRHIPRSYWLLLAISAAAVGSCAIRLWRRFANPLL